MYGKPAGRRLVSTPIERLIYAKKSPWQAAKHAEGETMIDGLKECPLFSGLSEQEIAACLQCSRSEIVSYEKDEIVFAQEDEPTRLLILLEGAVVVCSDSGAGRRSIRATFDRPGELFGEVFLFLNRARYDHYARAAAPSRILRMPKDFLCRTCGKNCDYHTRLITNMLTILAQKAYLLNQKLQILSCATLRQKIARVLLQHASADGRVTLPMNREELADFLNVTRPSLSRELMKMQGEGLLKIRKRRIEIADLEKLREI